MILFLWSAMVESIAENFRCSYELAEAFAREVWKSPVDSVTFEEFKIKWEARLELDELSVKLPEDGE